MAKQFKWHWNDGTVVTCGNFSRKYDKVMPSGSHMRIGHFACVVSLHTVVAARVYEEHNLDHPQCNIEKTSRFWNVHKRDRLSQCERVANTIKPEHPLFAEIMADIEREREHLK